MPSYTYESVEVSVNIQDVYATLGTWGGGVRRSVYVISGSKKQQNISNCKIDDYPKDGEIGFKLRIETQ